MAVVKTDAPKYRVAALKIVLVDNKKGCCCKEGAKDETKNCKQ